MRLLRQQVIGRYCLVIEATKALSAVGKCVVCAACYIHCNAVLLGIRHALHRARRNMPTALNKMLRNGEPNGPFFGAGKGKVDQFVPIVLRMGQHCYRFAEALWVEKIL